MADDAQVRLLATEVEGNAPWEVEPAEVGLKGGTVSGGQVLTQRGDGDGTLVFNHKAAK